MTAAIIVAVVGVTTLVCGLAALVVAGRIRLRGSAPASPAAEGDTVDPSVLVAPGTGTAQGRMSRAALTGVIVGESETAIVVIDEHRDVVLFNEQARALGLVRDRLLDDQIWDEIATMFDRALPERLTPDGSVDRTCDMSFEYTPPHFTSGFVATARATSRPVAGVRCLGRLVVASSGRPNASVERYVVIYGTDDSENLRVQATRRDFVANVSHELKTPVGAIGLLTEALLESHDDPESVRHFGLRVIAEATRMGNMVNELISLSRLQSAEPLTDLGVVDVDSLVDEAIGHAQISAEAANITLDTDAMSGLAVRGDRGLLLTALNNLISNAIAYSPPDTTVSVSRRVTNDNDGPEMVAIAVTDRGIGIDPRDQQRVFERFFRVDKARSRATGGTGLGLAIVKHVAANHKGTITLWSRPGTGSTFTLSIPRSHNNPAQPATATDTRHQSAQNLPTAPVKELAR